MNLTSKETVKILLKKYRKKPFKGLGQNFLTDKIALKKVIAAADLKPADIVLEIGPGTGLLTQELAKRTGKVIAVEKDPKMVEILKETLKDYKNVEIIFDDILKIKNYKLFKDSYKIVGNLPFYLTAPVIRRFLESENPPKEMVLLVQKEVGQRIVARPPDMNILAVSVQFYAKPKIIFYISKKSFWPRPKVDSAAIKITPFCLFRDNLGESEKLFFKIVRAGFSQPRKQLINNFFKKLGIEKNKIEDWLLQNNVQPTQRAETLSFKNWVDLTKNFCEHGSC